MKTIEERANEYVEMPCHSDCDTCHTIQDTCRFYTDKVSFIAGAQSEREELTRWNDPKEELPEEDKEVLVKIEGSPFNKYEVCLYSAGYWWCRAPIKQGGWCGVSFTITAWRYIHE